MHLVNFFVWFEDQTNVPICSTLGTVSDRLKEPKLKGLLSFETNSTGNHKNPMLLGYLLTLVPNSLMVIPCATSGHISAHSSVGIHQHGQKHQMLN